MTTGFAGVENDKDELIRKALNGAIFLSPIPSTAPTATTLFDATTGALKNPLPGSFKGIGRLTDAGAKFSRAVKQTDIMGWGTNDAVRTDITSDITTMVIEPQETNQQTIALYLGVTLASLVPGSNGVLEVPQPDVPVPLFMRMLAFAVDETSYGEIIIAKYFPRALVTTRADQTFANGADAITYGVTLQAYLDSTVGYAVDHFYGGDGAMAFQVDQGFSRTVTVTTATSTALVATTGLFYQNDVGAVVSGTGIASGSTIAAYIDSTHVTLSLATTASATGVAATIAGK